MFRKMAEDKDVYWQEIVRDRSLAQLMMTVEVISFRLMLSIVELWQFVERELKQ